MVSHELLYKTPSLFYHHHLNHNQSHPCCLQLILTKQLTSQIFFYYFFTQRKRSFSFERLFFFKAFDVISIDFFCLWNLQLSRFHLNHRWYNVLFNRIVIATVKLTYLFAYYQCLFILKIQYSYLLDACLSPNTLVLNLKKMIKKNQC